MEGHWSAESFGRRSAKSAHISGLMKLRTDLIPGSVPRWFFRILGYRSFARRYGTEEFDTANGIDNGVVQ
jgi:hypothetical protein